MSRAVRSPTTIQAPALGGLQGCLQAFSVRPCLPRPEKSPYRTDTYAKKLLGERAYRAATGVVEEEECD